MMGISKGICEDEKYNLTVGNLLKDFFKVQKVLSQSNNEFIQLMKSWMDEYFDNVEENKGNILNLKTTENTLKLTVLASDFIISHFNYNDYFNIKVLNSKKETIKEINFSNYRLTDSEDNIFCKEYLFNEINTFCKETIENYSLNKDIFVYFE